MSRFTGSITRQNNSLFSLLCPFLYRFPLPPTQSFYTYKSVFLSKTKLPSSSMAYSSLMKLTAPIFLIVFLITLSFSIVSIHALEIGLRAGASLNLFKECSRQCESKFCEAPPFLRYGKYCGLLYTGCPGEKPCDQLDSCCMNHDQCITRKGNSYLSQQCNKEFKGCVERFKKSRAPSFKGNTCRTDQVVKVLIDVADTAIAAGKVLGKP